MIKSNIMPNNACLNCGDIMDRATSVDHEFKPHEGAIAVCLKCGHIMSFDAQLKFRELTDEEIIDVSGNKTILDIQKARGHLFKTGSSK